MCGQFLYPERGQNQTIFDPLPPPRLVPVVIEGPLTLLVYKALVFFCARKYSLHKPES